MSREATYPPAAVNVLDVSSKSMAAFQVFMYGRFWVFTEEIVNIVSGETFHIYDKHSSKLPKPLGWLALRTMEDEINRILSRAESKFSAPNGGVCTSRTMGLLSRRHIVAGEFHYIGKEASTRWAGGVDLSMMPEAGALDSVDETCRVYERVVDPKYLDQVRTQAKQFSNKRLSNQSGVARSAIMNFKKGRNTINPRTLRKLTKGYSFPSKQRRGRHISLSLVGGA